MSRIRRLVTTALVATVATVALGSSASATPSLGRQTLSCGYGSVTTTAPGGAASQNYYGSNVADARWFAGIYHWDGASWTLAWSPMYVAQVASNAGPSMGTTSGYIGTWMQADAAPAAVSSVTFRAIPGHYYAVVNWVADSSSAVWNWSYTASGSWYCRA
jgi:hypothetical protein